MINRKIFFDRYRAELDKDNKLTAKEVSDLDMFLDFVDGSIGLLQMNQWAYVFATAFHETFHTFAPIKEIGGYSYFMRMYDVTGSRPQLAKRNGNIYKGDGAKYFGRGYVQITWRSNYAVYSRILGVDLINNPDLALVPKYAFKILVDGFINGRFTGKKISDYINKNASDYVNARRCINGTDKASLIASYARIFENILRSSIIR